MLITFKIRDAQGWVMPFAAMFLKNIGAAKLTVLAMPLFQVMILTQNKA
jgi:hypothetical protein